MSERQHISRAVACLDDKYAARELWRPDRAEQMAAIEILLASSIPVELRRALREREIELTRKDAA
ncbi:MAG TPA: hypothetical protein VFT89_07165 [Rhizobiaceae bacterium]|nr:hypothetical protein [Rhizobiaceae bacterium]